MCERSSVAEIGDGCRVTSGSRKRVTVPLLTLTGPSHPSGANAVGGLLNPPHPITGAFIKFDEWVEAGTSDRQRFVVHEVREQ